MLRKLFPILALLFVSFSCALNLDDPQPSMGTVSISITTTSLSARTILPNIAIDEYRIEFDGPESVAPVSTSSGSLSKELKAGTWAITVSALDAENAVVCSGEAVDVAVVAGDTISVPITVSPTTTGTGTIDVTITWPASITPAIDDYSVTRNGGSVPSGTVSFDTASSPRSIRYTESVASGDYTLVIELRTEATACATYVEAVQVVDNAASIERYDFTENDFDSPPSAPTGLSVAVVSDGLRVMWTDTSHTETGFRLERALDAGPWEPLEENLPAGTVAYTDTSITLGDTYHYRVRAFNAIGVSDYSATASGMKPVPSSVDRIIDHSNFDPAGLSDAEIAAAAALKVYFEHASTGQDIVGDSDTDSSTGQNSGDYGDGRTCGLALLYMQNNRYLMSRESFEYSNSATWFSSNTGLQDNMRGNPAPGVKLSGFMGISSQIRSAIDVAMFKFCWIDVWDGSAAGWAYTDGYVADGAAFAADMIADIETFEAANPGITHVYWTMPLERDYSYEAREEFNAAIRSYCEANDKWLLDIADLECHDDAGIKQTDAHGREVAYEEYVVPDGGHLSHEGRLKLAKALWMLLAGIAAE